MHFPRLHLLKDDLGLEAEQRKATLGPVSKKKGRSWPVGRSSLIPYI